MYRLSVSCELRTCILYHVIIYSTVQDITQARIVVLCLLGAGAGPGRGFGF